MTADRTRMPRAAAALLLTLVAPSAIAQTVRVSGVVLDERRSPVPGATLRLVGDVSTTSAANGRFEFANVIPGHYALTVTSVGYELRTLDLTIGRDTALTVVMTRRTITLDTMIVRPRNLRIKATAVDSATGDFLLQAQAILYPGARFASAVSGVFVFDSVSSGATTLVVEALEHLPARIELDVARDTTFRVALGIDSIALKMTALQVKRLEQRSHSVSMPTTSLNRDAIRREGVTNLHELLVRRSLEDPFLAKQTFVNAPDAGCYFVDDKKVSRAVFEGMIPELIERIEIYRSPGGPSPSFRPRPGNRNTSPVQMVRVYTKRYVSTLPRQQHLQRIVYMGTGLKPTCS
jgi:hypothetical protein